MSPAQSRLTRLAAFIAASTPRQPGDATLIARTTTIAAPNPQAGTARVFDLFTDSGAYYFGRTKSILAGQVAAHHTTGGDEFAAEIAAARYAVHGDLATARLRMAAMADSPTWGMYESEVKLEASELGVKPAPGQSLRDAVAKAMLDSDVWNSCEETLQAAAGNAQVRAGVLRLLSTVSGIRVTSGTTAGQPTLVIADVTPITSAPGTWSRATVTLDARTGIPIGETDGVAGHRPGPSSPTRSPGSLWPPSRPAGSDRAVGVTRWYPLQPGLAGRRPDHARATRRPPVRAGRHSGTPP